MASELVFSSVAKSNIPADEKRSIIRQFFDKMDSGSSGGMSRFSRGMTDTARVVRQSSESLAAGAAFGAIHATTGLDIAGKVPADLATGLVGAVGSVYMDNEFSEDVRNVAAAGMTTFGFRQMYGFIAEKKIAAGSAPVGAMRPLPVFSKMAPSGASKVAGDDDIGEDPIVALAKSL